MSLKRGKRYRLTFDVRPVDAIGVLSWPTTLTMIRTRFETWSLWYVLGRPVGDLGGGLHVRTVTIDLEMISDVAELPQSVLSYPGFLLEQRTAAPFEGQPPAAAGGFFASAQQFLEDVKRDAILAGILAVLVAVIGAAVYKRVLK